jgi:hypothetical protein
MENGKMTFTSIVGSGLNKNLDDFSRVSINLSKEEISKLNKMINFYVNHEVEIAFDKIKLPEDEKCLEPVRTIKFREFL